MESSMPIMQIMQRYNIAPDKDFLCSYKDQAGIVDQSFINTLLRAFEDDRSFSEADYQKFSLETIIDYIQRTHRYYLNKKLREIEQSVSILTKDYSDNHPLLLILSKFFFDYTNDLTIHIGIEEKQLLPYITSLLSLEKEEELDAVKYFELTKKYSLKTFIDNHHDTEEDLSIVRNTILSHQPPATNQSPYRILVSQLASFEKDLSVHALIEDRILIPRALELEEKLNAIFISNIKQN